MAFLSASIGGLLYYSSLKESALNEAKRLTLARTEVIEKNLSAYLSENVRPVKSLAGMKEFQDLLLKKDADSLAKANALLDHFKSTLAVDVCYLMDIYGNTVASSNRRDPDSFVGENFSFRPYFKEAAEGTPYNYLALGITSGKRGAYYSHPVYKNKRGAPIGVVVIKASIEHIERELSLSPDEIMLVTDPMGIVFISNRNEWLYHSINKLSPECVTKIAGSHQFGNGPWNWIGLQFKDEEHITGPSGGKYLAHRLGLYNYPGWNLTHLYKLKALSKIVSAPLIKITGPVVLSLCLFVGLAVFLLYKKARDEILKRRKFEHALRESEERYRSIYHNTPAMLHSVDTDGRLVSVSDNWLEVLGYERDDVIGQKLSSFLTPPSRHLAEEKVLPQFFNTGFCKDIPYQFIKKNGDTIDVLLSAIGDRDPRGNVIRSLAVSIDVTDRNRAEKALKLAKEALDSYSKDLENQVEKRTKDLTRILNQLRQLSGSIIVNQEKERSAIARELHDELGQVLTALRMDLVWLSERLKATDAKASGRALAMCELIDKTIEEVRGMAIRLRPGVLDDLGLVDALEWYTGDFERRTFISCTFEHRNVPSVLDTVATAAYRIAQETLTNVARHADANRAEVILQAHGGVLTLMIMDNGRGFDTAALSETKALGIAGMRERAGLVGGVLEVHSQPGKGTRVYFKVPLDGHVRITS
ncbi:MAG: PAS domain S-box protein [Thermodesulfobacteriota bacterium]